MIRLLAILLATFAAGATQAQGRTNEVVDLLKDFEAKAAAGTPRALDNETDDSLERLGKASRSTVLEALPAITRATTSSYVPVRRLAVMDLFGISMRSDARTLLTPETSAVIPLLTDDDLPVRRVALIVADHLRPYTDSPLVPALREFLSREDAVSTIGSGVFWTLLEGAPDDAVSTRALVAYMARKDQTSASRDELLGGIGHVVAQNTAAAHSVSENLDIGRAMMPYANDPSERVSLEALQLLRSMSASVRSDNQRFLVQVAADARRSPGVRAAAAKALPGTSESDQAP